MHLVFWNGDTKVLIFWGFAGCFFPCWPRILPQVFQNALGKEVSAYLLDLSFPCSFSCCIDWILDCPLPLALPSCWGGPGARRYVAGTHWAEGSVLRLTWKKKQKYPQLQNAALLNLAVVNWARVFYFPLDNLFSSAGECWLFSNTNFWSVTDLLLAIDLFGLEVWVMWVRVCVLLLLFHAHCVIASC